MAVVMMVSDDFLSPLAAQEFANLQNSRGTGEFFVVRVDGTRWARNKRAGKPKWMVVRNILPGDRDLILREERDIRYQRKTARVTMEIPA